MADNTLDLFKGTLIVMFFYSFAITLLSHSLPVESLQYIDLYTNLNTNVDLQGVSAEVQDSLQSQSTMPVIELGSLVFYSGNLILDLLLNFTFAIPEMIGLLISGIALLFNLDSFIVVTIQLFASAIMIVIYFIGLINMLAGIRSGRGFA